MKIGYDGKRATGNLTGLGNYSRLVIEGIGERYPEDTLLVYTPRIRENGRLDKMRGLPNVEFRFPASQGLKGSLWRTFGITNNLRADGVELFHGLSNELPLNIRSAHIPTVLTMHDVIYRRMPECYKPLDRFLYDYKYGQSCRNASHIIAVSKKTKEDVMEYYGIPSERITVIYQGCDSQFRRVCDKNEIEEIKQKYNLPARYLLQVGTIEKRKNLELTIRALPDISPDMSLVVVGRDHHGYKEYVQKLARERGVEHRVIFLEGLPFAELPAIYQGAEVVVYPSKYEGFGIPILEALESRRPVIAATGSCLEEAGGEDSLYVNPESPREMVAAIHSILSDPRGAEMMTRAGKEYAARFNSNDMVEKIMEVYRMVLE